MAYVSLYRKYRPQTFDDVVGQTHVTRTLRNAIEEDRLSHAYLFTGPRGTGKTSTARILAKAINCEQGPTPTPCGTCEQCTSITAGSSVDVIELDMASYGKVEDARDLRDRALFAPARARHKIYILDEVHMASTAAFNALLKLIEEPPAHVLFAMATTDPQKVLPTIMSRVQRLDLRRVAASDVAAHVRSLCTAEGYTIDDGALEAVVRAGDGSVRDTLSVLEQVLAYAGTEVTAEAVAQTLGMTPADRVIDTVDRIGDRDLAGLLGLVQDLVDDGLDLRRFTLDLVQHLRDLLVLEVAPDRPDLVDATDERRRRLQAQTAVMPRASILRAVAVLADTVTEQRQGSPRLPLELALASLAVPSAGGDLADLADRVARLEETGVRAAPVTGAAPPDRGAWRGSAVPAPAADPTVDETPSVAETPIAETPVDEAPPVVAMSAPAPDRPAPGPEESTPPHPDEPIASADDQPAAHPSPPDAPDAAPTDADAPLAGPDAASLAGDGPGSGAVDAADGVDVAAVADADDVVDATDAQVPETASEAVDAGHRGAASEAVAADQGAAASETDGAGTGDADELSVITGRWEEILDRVRDGSKRHHAMFLPAVPVAAGRGILTLRYGTRYASFHAEQARSGELQDALRAAVEALTGLRMRLDIVIEGEDHRRRPLPPSVTPDDARTPILDDAAAAQSPAATRSSSARGSTTPGVANRRSEPPEEPEPAATSALGDAGPAGTSRTPQPGGPAPVQADPGDEELAVREAEASAPVPVGDVDALLERELGATLIEEFRIEDPPR